MSRTMLNRLWMWPCSALVDGLSGMWTTKTTGSYCAAKYLRGMDNHFIWAPRWNDCPFLLNTLLPSRIQLFSLSTPQKIMILAHESLQVGAKSHVHFSATSSPIIFSSSNSSSNPSSITPWKMVQNLIMGVVVDGVRLTSAGGRVGGREDYGARGGGRGGTWDFAPTWRLSCARIIICYPQWRHKKPIGL